MRVDELLPRFLPRFRGVEKGEGGVAVRAPRHSGREAGGVWAGRGALYGEGRVHGGGRHVVEGGEARHLPRAGKAQGAVPKHSPLCGVEYRSFRLPPDLELGGEVELDFGEIGLGHLQHIARVGHEDVAPVAVDTHELVLAFLEGLEGLGVVAFDPAGLVEADGLPAALGAILVEQSVLNDLELQLPHGADDLAAVELADEELGHALVHELVDALVELFRLHGVVVFDILEHLGREAGEPLEVELFAAGEGVADLEVAGIGQTHDVAGVCLVDDRFLLGHEGGGARESHHLVVAHVLVVGVALELARAYLDEGDAAAVVGVHVGVNLEDETGEVLLLGTHQPLHGLDGAGRGGNLHEAVEQLLDTEHVEGRAEEDGRRAGGQVVVDVELGVYPLDELEVGPQLLGILLADVGFEFGAVHVVELDALGHHLLVGGEEVEVLLVDVVDALELLADVDGPAERTDVDFELRLQLVEDVEGVAPLAVELVDKDDNGRVAHAAHLHELAGLGLHALGHVDDDDDAVDRREGAVGVLGKILVAGGVENVYLVVAVVEAHDRGGYRDATLFLDLHPVGCSGLFDFVRLDRPGNVDGTAEKQQLFGEGGFTGIGVADDGECSAFTDFLCKCTHDVNGFLVKFLCNATGSRTSGGW